MSFTRVVLQISNLNRRHNVMPHAVTTNQDESQFLKTHNNGGSMDNTMHFTPPEPDVEAYAGGEKRAIYAQSVAIAEA